GFVHGVVLGHRTAGLVDRIGDLRLGGTELQRPALPGLLAQLSRDVRPRPAAPSASGGSGRHPGRPGDGGAAVTRLLDVLRLLLGAVMVVTAVQYFLPPLLTALPTIEWN